MKHAYTIGRLGKAADVPISTVRYYEQRGLLSPEQRTQSNYRLYGVDSLRRLRFIRIAQANGFTLEDIVLLLAFRDGHGDACGKVEHLVENRLDHITAQLKEFRRVQKVLRSTLEWCRNPRVKGRCQVLDDLDKRSSVSGEKPRRTRSQKTA